MTAREPRLDAYAVAAPGLEDIVAGEARALGLDDVRVETGGVAFAGTRADVWRANLHLAVASRVLVRLGTFHASSFAELERRAAALPWARYLNSGDAVRFRVSAHKSRLYHTGAVAERLVAACAAMGAVPAARAAVGDDEPGDGNDEQLFVVRLVDDVCTVSADSSGALLHRRGYRGAAGKAPLRETLAAAVLLAGAWDLATAEPVVDPMCGSGTLVIEAARLARRIPPGIARSFRFQSWPGFDTRAWERLVEDARAAIVPSRGVLARGFDRDAGVVRAATDNAARALVADDVELATRSLSDLPDAALLGARGCLVTNAPYGVRVGDRATLRNLGATLGRVARARLPGWHVALLVGGPELPRALGWPVREVASTRNGGLAVRIVVGTVPERGREQAPRSRDTI